MILLGRDICGNLEVSSRKEWLETNGLGGYASSTVAGMHTRGYHSLLTVALEQPLRRVVMLSQLEESVTYGGQKFSLSTNQYQDALNPQGYRYLEEFRLDPFPTFTFRLADLLLEKQLFMSYGVPLTWITYRLLTQPPEKAEVHLAIRPLVNFRDHHLRGKEHRFFSTHHDLEKKIVRLLPDRNLPPLNICHNAQGFEHSALWYHNLFYREEAQRRLECLEDLFSPGILNFRLDGSGEASFLAASAVALENPNPETAAHAERLRRREIIETLPPADEFGRSLALAADQFLVRRGDGLSVVAGYHWLPDSGREAMMALPGLTLSMKRFGEAKTLLRTFRDYCSEGMLPSYFTESDSNPYYNTADAALWFCLAVHHYLQATGDKAFVQRELWPILIEIVSHYRQGTRYGIHMDADGLIEIPEEGAHLTWMDAKVGDWVVTPRAGKPAEINALWYNTLCIVRDLAETFGDQAAHRENTEWAERCRESYRKWFWNEAGGYIYDRVEEHHQDPTLRPNQLLALSLPYPLWDGEKARAILKTVEQELGTSFGFRTLNPGHPEYKGVYEGDLMQREGAAFQGSAWPWLLGSYADALRRVYGTTPETMEKIRRLLKPFHAHLLEAGLGTISEMFDGAPPHSARGCIARACNVAEIIRLHLETRPV
ncbi:MAG: amylo-alpha-1,6-glucosidase [candidate division FCPU426 bacterium]